MMFAYNADAPQGTLTVPIPLCRALNEIAVERQYQDEMWGSEFDDKNTVNDWITYMARYASNAGTATPAGQRVALVKVAALAVAAVEAFDRNEGFPPRHYEGNMRKD